MSKALIEKSALQEALKLLETIEGAHSYDRLQVKAATETLQKALADAKEPASPKRMWVNQPSTLQPYHDLHGTHVLAVPEYEGMMHIFFLSGNVISQQASTLALSDGWPAHACW